MDNQERYKLIKRADEIFDKEFCVYSEISKCNGPIIKAHTISKSHGLRHLLEEGHVYARDKKIHFTPTKRDWVLEGLKTVSTFKFACAKHDNDLFKVIETPPFNLRPASAIAMFMRAIGQEVYEDMRMQEILSLIGKHSSISSIKEKDIAFYFDLIIKGKVKIQTYHVKYKEQLPFLATTIASPFHAINGELLFDSFDLNTIAPIISINVINSENIGQIIFTWLDKDEAICKKFAESFFIEGQITNTILGFLSVSAGNLIFKPSFFEGILPSTLNRMNEIFNKNIDPTYLYTNQNPLLNFEIPEPEEVRFYSM